MKMKYQKFSFFLQIITIFLLIIAKIQAVGMVYPTQYPRVSALSEGMQSIYSFYFRVETQIVAGNYVKIQLSEFTTINVERCQISLNSYYDWQTTDCSTSNNIIYILLPADLESSYLENAIQIDLDEINPQDYQSNSIQIWTVNDVNEDEQFVYDMNFNFGSIPFLKSVDEELQVEVISYGTLSTQNQPNQLNTLRLKIHINDQIGDEDLQAARLKVIVTSPWEFQTTSVVTVEADQRYSILNPLSSTNGVYLDKDLYKMPSLLEYELETPNIISIVFDEIFLPGRTFILQITDIMNPSQRDTGLIKIYSQNFNSNEVIELNENVLDLEIFSYNIDCELAPVGGLTLGGPVGFYKGTKQFIKVVFTPEYDVPGGNYITVDFGDPNIVVKGSGYFDPQIQPHDSNEPIKFIYSDSDQSIVTVQNFGTLTANTEYYLSVRVDISFYDSDIQATISIDEDSSSSSPLYQGTSSLYDLKTSVTSILTSFYGTSANDGFIDLDSSNIGDMVLSFSTGSADQSNGSYLEIYTSAQISGTLTQGANCEKNAPSGNYAPTCSITSTSDYSLITIGSDNVSSFFSAGSFTVDVSGLVFAQASNYEDSQFEFYFRLYYSDGAGSSYIDWISTPIVQYTANSNVYLSVMSNFGNGDNDYIYPSLVNMVFVDTSIFSYTISADEIRTVTLFAQFGLKNLVFDPESQDSYSCGSNLSGISCEYVEGDPDQEVDQYLTWDRVHIYLPDTVSQKFHIIIPDLYTTTTTVYYSVLLGAYDQNTRIYRYIYHQGLSSFTPTGDLTLLTNSNQATLQIEFSGYSASEINNVPIYYDTNGNNINGNSGTNYGAGIIIVTDWQIWQQGISDYNTINDAAYFSTADDENSPVGLSYIDVDGKEHFISVFPLLTVSSSIDNYFTVDNILLPYSHDLPNHNIYITHQSGTTQGYTRYFNSGRDWFYRNTLIDLYIECDYQQLGFKNSFCTVYFKPNYKIYKNAKIYLYFYKMNVYTDECSLYYEQSSNNWVQIESTACEMNLESDIMTVEIDEEDHQMEQVYYKLQFYGMQFSEEIGQRLILSVRDKSGNIEIEEKEIMVTCATESPQIITITELEYGEINPYVFSSLKVTFEIPRAIYENEEIQFDMGKDLNDVNVNTDRLNIELYRYSDDYQIEIAVNFDQQKINILFKDKSLFVADTYYLQIFNQRNPASNENDIFRIQFIRQFDLTYVLNNTISSTASYPELSSRTNSQITLNEANYLQEGCLQELKFGIILQQTRIDSFSQIVVNFPIYYSPALTNFEEHLYCAINNIQVQCQNDSDFPYRIIISNSPLRLQKGDSFELIIFGINTPLFSKRYLSEYSQETIFVGIRDSQNSESYAEYIHLTPPGVQEDASSPGNPFMISEYAFLQFVDISDNSLGSLSDHTIKFFTMANIPANSGMLIVFPSEYESLIITSSLSCYIVLEDGSQTTESACEIQFRNIKLYTNLEIPADSYFYVKISNVPTPPYDGEVDFNELIIQIFDPSTTNKDIITRNFYLTNRVLSYEFEELQNVLTVNNNNVIQVVKGTYSQPIYIKTPDASRFITNLQLDTSAQGLTFLPNSVAVYLGDYDAQFRIGAQQDLQEKPYQFNIEMEEKYYRTFYSIANTYIIFVTSNPVQISTPQYINIPVGGCTLPQVIQLENAPFEDIEIAIQYVYSQYPENMFFVDLEISSYVLSFDSDYNYRYISFCLTDKYTEEGMAAVDGEVIEVGLRLGGENQDSYTLQYDTINLNVITKSKISPTLKLSQNTVTRTTFIADVLIPTDGCLFWHLYVENTAEDLALNQIQFKVKYQNLILKESSDSQQNINGEQYDERVGIYVVEPVDSTTPVQMTISDLQPEITYVLCGYFETQFKESTTENQCIKFTTKNWDKFTKVSIAFTDNNYQDMMNDIICYYVRKVQTQIYNMIEASSISCSFGVVPDYYYYEYSGLTFSKNEHMTNLYLIPDLELENDPALNTIQTLYDSSDVLQQSIIQDALDNYDIDWISTGSYIKQFEYSQAINAEGDFSIPSIKNIEFKVEQTNNTVSIYVNDIQLSHDGAIYFVMERIYQLEFDPEYADFQEIPINIIKTPTAEQIVGCKNSYGTKAQYCIRAVVTNDQKVTAFFDDLLYESSYMVYYVLANEYPLRPVISDKVYEKQINIGFKSSQTSGNILKVYTLMIFLVISLFSLI